MFVSSVQTIVIHHTILQYIKCISTFLHFPLCFDPCPLPQQSPTCHRCSRCLIRSSGTKLTHTLHIAVAHSKSLPHSSVRRNMSICRWCYINEPCNSPSTHHRPKLAYAGDQPNHEGPSTLSQTAYSRLHPSLECASEQLRVPDSVTA